MTPLTPAEKDANILLETSFFKNKFVRTKMRPKGGTRYYSYFIIQIFLRYSDIQWLGDRFEPYFDCDSDFINFMPFPLKIRNLKKNTQWMDQPQTDGPPIGQTDPHMEMRGRI